MSKIRSVHALSEQSSLPFVLIVDDDEELQIVLSIHLRSHGYDVGCAKDGLSMRDFISKRRPDLILLDLSLPDITGFELAKEVRSNSNVPIIMLTGQDAEMLTVAGLELGADDFIKKPSSLHEIRARIGAVLKRYNQGSQVEANNEVRDEIAEFVGWSLNFTTRKLYSPTNELIKLTSDEHKLLCALVKNHSQILNREQLLDYLEKEPSENFDRSIDTKITRLRKKIEENPKKPVFIKTERNIGYVFDLPVFWA